MPDYTPEQKTAVEATELPILVAASAGSGKTWVLVERYLHLIRSGVPSNKILAMTFTREAASEMQRRILRSHLELKPRVGTIHSFCLEVVERYGSLVGLPRFITILDEYTFSEVLSRLVRDFLETTDDENLGAIAKLGSIRSIEEVVRKLLDSDLSDLPTTGLIFRFQPMLEAMRAHLYQQGSLRFSDLETLTLKLLREQPLVQLALENDIAHILVDEFQDTSRQQWEILKTLGGTSLQKLFAVGDPKQSIYSFRNADIEIFRELEERIRTHSGTYVELSMNFRTEKPLLFHLHRLDKTLFGSSKEVENVPISAAPSYFDVIRWNSADEVSALGEYLRSFRKENPDKSIGVLFRFSEKMKHYGKSLRSLGLNAQVTEVVPLFKSDTALGICYFLRSLADPLEDHLVASFLRSPFIQMSPQDLKDLRTLNSSLLNALRSKPEFTWFVELAEHGTHTLQKLLKSLFAHGKIALTDSTVELLKPLSRYTSLADAVEGLSNWMHGNVLMVNHSRGGNGVIRLLTVHGAKGLEFDLICLVDNLRGMPPAHLETKLYGDDFSKQKKQREEEELKRLLYVAATRARRRLCVFLPKEVKSNRPSVWGSLLEEWITPSLHTRDLHP